MRCVSVYHHQKTLPFFLLEKHMSRFIRAFHAPFGCFLQSYVRNSWVLGVTWSKFTTSMCFFNAKPSPCWVFVLLNVRNLYSPFSSSMWSHFVSCSPQISALFFSRVVVISGIFFRRPLIFHVAILKLHFRFNFPKEIPEWEFPKEFERPSHRSSIV